MRQTALLALASLLCAAFPSFAATFKSAGECTIGRHVADSQNKTGVVTSVNQSNLCHVRLDAGGESYYLFWMLHAAGGTADTTDKLRPGKYACYTYSGGRLNYTFMDVLITGPNTYRSGGATFRFHEAPGKRIIFENGPLAGRETKLSDGPSLVIGATTCDLQKK